MTCTSEAANAPVMYENYLDASPDSTMGPGGHRESVGAVCVLCARSCTDMGRMRRGSDVRKPVHTPLETILTAKATSNM